MASERRTCEKPKCHRKFSRPLGSRRVFCETCSPPRKRAAVDQPPPSDDGPGPIELRLIDELELAGRMATVEAEIARRLAREMDSGKASGGQLGGLMPRLLAARAEALRGVKLRTDRLDELAEARARRAASA